VSQIKKFVDILFNRKLNNYTDATQPESKERPDLHLQKHYGTSKFTS